LFITAEQAVISPVETILSHFPALETRQQGRLAEEAERLNRLFQQVTRHSLILLNETFSSTSAREAVYLAQDILAGLRIIGVQAIFATHLIELVDYLDEITASVEGESALFSLVAGIEPNADGTPIRTFVIQPGQPAGRSYAQEIARQHGISLEQILEAHQQRITDSHNVS
jgi:DNA mismatch repair ATPase MutS